MGMRDLIIETKATDNEHGKEPILMEMMMKSTTPQNQYVILERLQNYMDSLRTACGAGEYKRYGKFLVKETFAGDATLTELLTDYIEKTASLKY